MLSGDLAAAPEAPSLASALLRSGALLVLLAAAGYLLLRWQRRLKRGAQELEVLDRTFLARGASLALVRAGGRRLLLGVSADGVRLVSDLGPAPLAPDPAAPRGAAPAGAAAGLLP